MSVSVTVYSKPNCVQCTATYREMVKQGVEYDVIDISQDDEARSYVMDLGHLAAPVVVVNGGEEHWSGYSPDRIKKLASLTNA